MTSGQRRTKQWLLRFERSKPQYIEPLMGWTADDDPMAHVELRFHSLGQAIRYAKQNGLDYCVQGSHQQRQMVEADVPRLKAISKESSQIRLESRKKAVPDLAKLTNQQRTNKLIRTDDIYFHYGTILDANSNQLLDRRLDQGLQETFPASDSVGIIIS